MFNYFKPATLEEALSILADASKGAVPYAGGTDLLPRWSRHLAPIPHAIVDVKGLKELHGIARANGEIRIGACALMSEIARDPLLLENLPVLAEASGRIACPQIRNRATLGGNLCNASPAADTALPLLLADAMLDLASRAKDGGVSTRAMLVSDFFRGPGRTAMAEGEILVAARFKPLPTGAFAAWDKFGTRPAMEIAVASVGVFLHVQEGRVARARVGYGSVAPIPLRGRGAEAALEGCSLSTEVLEACASAARAEISPISDVRASDGYRREIVGVMIKRMLERAKGG